MMTYFATVGARIPKPNPAFDPEVYRRAAGHEIRILWGPFAGSRPLEDDER